MRRDGTVAATAGTRERRYFGRRDLSSGGRKWGDFYDGSKIQQTTGVATLVDEASVPGATEAIGAWEQSRLGLWFVMETKNNHPPPIIIHHHLHQQACRGEANSLDS